MVVVVEAPPVHSIPITMPRNRPLKATAMPVGTAAEDAAIPPFVYIMCV